MPPPAPRSSVAGFDDGSWPPEAPAGRTHDLGLRKDFCRVFETGRILGRGSFAVVRECTHTETGEKFAVKVMTKSTKGARLDPKFATRVHHEVDMLRTLGEAGGLRPWLPHLCGLRDRT